MLSKPSFQIIYDDPYMFAVNKDAGIASCPGISIRKGASVMEKTQDFFKEKFGFKPYILHRLDFDTSGVMLFGKFRRDREKLENIFRDSRTKKTYLALVKGVPKKTSGVIDRPLEARMIHKKVPAKTHYRVLEKFISCSLVEAVIETGRKHQIRKHFAMIGCPLVNDRQYGDFKFNRMFVKKYCFKKIFLHAWKLQFFHPFLRQNIDIVTPYVPKPRRLF